LRTRIGRCRRGWGEKNCNRAARAYLFGRQFASSFSTPTNAATFQCAADQEILAGYRQTLTKVHRNGLPDGPDEESSPPFSVAHLDGCAGSQ
jgi:hypothetical protein